MGQDLLQKVKHAGLHAALSISATDAMRSAPAQHVRMLVLRAALLQDTLQSQSLALDIKLHIPKTIPELSTLHFDAVTGVASSTTLPVAAMDATAATLANALKCGCAFHSLLHVQVYPDPLLQQAS